MAPPPAKLKYATSFKRAHKKLAKQNAALEQQIDESVRKLVEAYPGPWPSSLRAEKLHKGKAIWSIRVNDEIRIVFELIDNVFLFMMVGHHDQIYRSR